MAEAEPHQFKLVSLAQIQIGRWEQPRHHFHHDALEELTESVRHYGILQPILVRPIDCPNVKYELVAGERRFRAAMAAGLDRVPVIIRWLDDLEAATLSLVENLQREDLNAIEETRGIVRLLSLHLQLSWEATVSFLVRMAKEAKGQTAQNVLDREMIASVIRVFDRLGKISWESFVTCRLPLLNLPADIQLAIQTQALNYTKALALSRLKDNELRSILLEQVLEQNLSVRQIQSQIRQLQHPNLPNQPHERLFNQDIECSSQSNFEANLATNGKISVTNQTKAGAILNHHNSSPTSESSSCELLELEAESQKVQIVPLTYPERLKQANVQRVNLRLISTSPQSNRQDVEELPLQNVLEIQIAILTQIESISRQIRESLASNRRDICTPKQQRRLLALLDQMHQILSEEH
ncbi:MAG: Nucleoid occlusion protein [Chroococcidiopsis cubana SAG 39.79]|uniref:ParB-like N-terminal domain-containing protein n=1 Tax=Chroococcidiopsis cubana SAG 39.79 TaxID=388085 RepID=A0AB37UD72_9CYAN|nr:ParB/RepB/Spo0J family partition protein [Chroococcidiopsis cubana]MDZ4871545.1 Nucleoid occlusion protein [Chroococcidiopsis cubana SAG 39.79]PSB61981.1 hypothetical protein C7B79_19895 [Chroococcidiopsis cubana CCALA 043]RUT05826.1 hypothetical protein DSM107010_54140 [Chroococcidiopsis cubana SAG 39.79]